LPNAAPELSFLGSSGPYPLSFSHHFDRANIHHKPDERGHRDPAHSEKNDSWSLQGGVHNEPVHSIQMWVLPDQAGITPGNERPEIDDTARLSSGALVPVASGMDGHRDETAHHISTDTGRCTPHATPRAGASTSPTRRSCACSRRAAA
jgi:hypothetical protein